MSANKARYNHKGTASRKRTKGTQGKREYYGEEVMGNGRKVNKGSERVRLMNEIEDNLYDESVEIEVIDDPKLWGRDVQIRFEDTVEKNYKKILKKYVKIVKKAYKWLRESKRGQGVTSMVKLRSELGIDYRSWDKAIEASEEFAYYSSLISDVIGARLHDSGINDSGNQVFKIFSLKNHLPHEFMDKKEVSETKRIEVIQIEQVSDEEVRKHKLANKKRLKG